MTSQAAIENIPDHEVISKCWHPQALVYDPVKVGSIDGTDTTPHDVAIIRAQNAIYHPNKKIHGKPECTVFVGRLSVVTTQDDVYELFAQYGPIKRCRLVEDIVTGRSKCYAFVEYENENFALKAYRYGNRQKLKGKEILVDMECERLLPGWIPRRLGGGFSGRKESGQLRFGCRVRPFNKPIQLLKETDAKPVIRGHSGSFS